MKDMEYISMERAVEEALLNLGDDAAVHIFPEDLDKCSRSECVVEVTSVRAGSPTRGKTIPLFSIDQVSAAIANYLKGVGDGVELPAPTRTTYPLGGGNEITLDYFTADQLRQAIAPYAARLAQAERDVTRLTMLAETDKASADHWRGVAEKQGAVLLRAIAILENSSTFDSMKVVDTKILINQQLGEK